jgi:lactoylglutathione lyase
MGIHLCLTAIRVADIDRSAQFYGLMGLVFVKHSHGKGPLHYASEEGGVVFEIYPADAENPISAATHI